MTGCCIDDLIESAEKIERFLHAATLEAFRNDDLLFDAVLHNLQVIGEARAMAPDVDWSGPARLRDLIAHHYFAVDAQIVWEAATRHVPHLLREAKNLRSRVEAG